MWVGRCGLLLWIGRYWERDGVAVDERVGLGKVMFVASSATYR